MEAMPTRGVDGRGGVASPDLGEEAREGGGSELGLEGDEEGGMY